MSITTPITLTLPLHVDTNGILYFNGTSVRLASMIADYLRGGTPEIIADHFPAVELPTIYLVIGAYLSRKAEFDAHFKREIETLKSPSSGDDPPPQTKRFTRELLLGKIADEEETDI